ncbi:MAG: asparagine synthase-related protein [Planctomycetaceae bacterium]
MLAIVLELGSTNGVDLNSAFQEGFGLPITAGAQVIEVGTGRGLVCSTASHFGIGQDLFTSGVQRFWDTRSQRYLEPPELQTLVDHDRLSDCLCKGLLQPALDVPLLLLQKSSGDLFLFSSCAGARVLYFTIRNGLLYAADHMNLMRIASQDSVDPIAVGEIIRFGANYSSRSVINTVKRIPFGHYLKISNGKVLAISPYSDFSFEPDESLPRIEVKKAIRDAISENLSLAGPCGAELLFSSGVDSSILGAIGSAGGHVRRGWFMSVKEDSAQQETAVRGASIGKFELKNTTFNQAWDDVEEAVFSYSEPTLDFSALPTYQLLRSTNLNSQPSFLIDGTGGDAWFGFGSLAHARVWGQLRIPAKFLGNTAGAMFSRFLDRATSKWAYPSMVLARCPRNGDSALGHMCANSAWRQMLNITDSDWLQLENEISLTLNATAPRSAESEIGRVIVADATLIAVAQFAAKTGQYSATTRTQTLYPFLMPNIVNIGRHLPVSMMLENGVSKPLLKEIAVECGYPRGYVYRNKSGFQPPLAELLLRPENLANVRRWIEECEDELSPIFTPFIRTLPRRLLSKNSRPLNIKGLYCLWGVLSVRIWLHHFRLGTWTLTQQGAKP